MDAKADEYLSYLVGTLEIPLWNVDTRTIKVIGTTVSQNELIVRLTITDYSKTIVYSLEEAHGPDTISRSGNIFHNGKFIGRVEFSLTKIFYQQNSRNLLLFYAIGTLFILISLVLVTNIFMRTFLKKPLHSLNKIVDSYAAGVYDSPVAQLPYLEFQAFRSTLAHMAGTIRRQMGEIRSAEEKYRSIFENAKEGIFQSTAEGRFLSVNPAFADILGYDSPEQLIAGVADIGQQHYVNPQDRERLRNILDEHGFVEGVEAELRRRDGSGIWICLNAHAVRDREGEVLYYEGSVEDITRRKQTEKELAKYRQHLEELIRDRTVELVGARDRAEAASRAKTAFLANMSHELRTPLNAVIGYAQVLRMRHDDDSALCDALDIIQQSGDHLLTLINDILDISIIEAGRINLHPTTINFATFLDGIANVIRLRAEAKHLTFEMETPDTLPPWVMADETRLRQILLNLLGNAVKFTHTGQVALRLERRDPAAAAHPTRQVLLRFEISDTGIGIEQDQIERIFQPFEQIRPVDNEGSGTGLGLAISRELVQLMGGRLHVESEPGRGSVFWFEAAFPETGPADNVPQPPERFITGYSGPRRRVLIADDIASNRAALAEMLERVGFETMEAVDGRQVVHLAREARPHLILMDRRMPGMDGFQAARRIRRIAGLEKVIMIAVTADVSEESKARCRKLGIDAFLPKPVYWPRLVALLEKHVKVEWVYASNIEAQSVKESEDLVPPSPEELKNLREMARRGNLRAINDRASRLETMDERMKPFTRRLRRLAQAFEDRAVLALIEQFIEE